MVWDRINALATRENISPAPAKRQPKTRPEGPWEVSGPEEGDKCDTSVWVCNAHADEWEVFEITEGTTAQKKRIANRIVDLMNKGGAR